MKYFDFEAETILENEFVLLRPLVTNDLKHLSKFSIEEPELWKYSLLSGSGLENLKIYIEHALKGRKDKTTYPFIVFDKQKKEYAGSTRFYDFQKQHNIVQLGFTWYGKSFQGTGLNKNCKYLLLEFAFEQLKLERVEFRADNKNERSIAAMKSIGCKVEGVLRNNCAGPDGRRDSIVLSILRKEWFDEVKQNLLAKINIEFIKNKQ